MNLENNGPLTRYARYERVLSEIVKYNALHLDELKQQCDPEQPAFVTRIVRDLENSGWIICESLGSREAFRWSKRRDQFSLVSWLDEKIYGPTLANTPLQQRPRERLLSRGAASLRTADLLAILVRSGRPGESALQAGEKIAARFHWRLEKLPTAGQGDLKSISCAVSKAAFCQIMAGIELGRRVATAASEQPPPQKIGSTEDAINYCRNQFSRLAADGSQEEFHIVCLDTKHQVIQSHQITVGTLNASLVHPREVFRPAIQDAAASIILVHNHPSGDPNPSREDLQVTKRLEQAGQTIGIDVLDHIVLGREAGTSLREHQHLS